MSVSIFVGAEPAPFEGEALFADGAQAGSRPVALTIDEASRTLRIEGVGEGWALDDLRRLRDQAGGGTMVLAHADGRDARLYITDAETRRLLDARAPRLNRRIAGTGLWRILVWAGLALGAVALILMLAVPRLADGLAKVLPPEGEAALGRATLVQIRRALAGGVDPVPVCRSDGGDAALDRMLARLTNGAELPHPVQITVLPLDMVNAFALPGGQVVLFRGLIDAAAAPDEVAAVLAHEIGHVAASDPTRLALRSAGSLGVLGLFFGDFAGGALTLFLVEQIIAAQYGQAAEIAADAYATDRLRAAGRDPAALAAFFQRLRDESGDLPGILSHVMPHPALLSRIEAVDAGTGETGAPLLDATAWQALRGICDGAGLAEDGTSR